MEDLGDPVSYLMLEKGTAVYSADGERIGTVSEVRADLADDIFDGIILDTNSILPGGKTEIPAEEIDHIYERGVVLAPAG
jgi:sporulation protein YlmC with PRC-barrel domain